MAPVKRSTTTAQRETRTTRAATVAKKRVASSEKKTNIPSSNETSSSSSTKSRTATRQTKKLLDEDQPKQSLPQNVEEPCVNDEAEPKITTTRTRSTRATAPASSLATAPRRRIKITPLDGPGKDSKESTNKTKSARLKAKDADVPDKSSTNSKETHIEDEAQATEESVPAASKSRSTRKTTSKAKDEKAPKDMATVKTRGRPRSSKTEPKSSVPETTISTRATRSQRSELVVSPETTDPPNEAPAAKLVTGARKKVTFQDLPNEQDKENQPLPQAKAKNGSGKKATDDTKTATGLRAKPIRKAASVTTSARGRKPKATIRKVTSKVADEDASEREEDVKKRLPQVLTPKKITQVAKSSSPEREDEQISEGEDELNGGKTPIRDLSMSPRRPPTAAIARALSPPKKLDFRPNLAPTSPDKTTIFRDSEAEPTGVLASPARRPAASSFTDATKASPKRGLNDAAHLLFPSQVEASTSVAANLSNGNQGNHTLSTMLQSPKRTGALDPNFFSQSAMKKSNSKSPFKSSLFGSPAKRLFSPMKKTPNPRIVDNPGQDVDDEPITQHPAERMDDIESEVTASSHFRSSSSPLRVMRAELDPVDLDFDDSILQVRSPWKVAKSPAKVSSQPDFGVTPGDEENSPQSPTVTTEDAAQTVEPATLDRLQDQYFEPAVAAENQPKISLVQEGDGISVIETAESNEEEAHPESVPVTDTARRGSVSQFLFRSTNSVSGEESSSEDELTGEKTPIRPRKVKRSGGADDQPQSRKSTGFPDSVSKNAFGFTPLAARMSSWLASSPEKSPEQRSGVDMTDAAGEFSPLAGQHIDGEVVISRNATPLQKLDKQLLALPASSSRPQHNGRKSLDLRKSLAQRQSFGPFSSIDSPARNPQFDEYMEIRAMEERADLDDIDEESLSRANEPAFDMVMDVDGETSSSDQDEEATILDHNAGLTEEEGTEPAGDLTTDLIKFTHASDTAMIDFQKLANEADDLASDEIASPGDISTDAHNGAPVDDAILSRTSVEPAESAHEAEVSSPPASTLHTTDDVPNNDIDHPDISSPILQPVSQNLDSPSILVIAQEASSPASSSSAVYSSTASPARTAIFCTPKPNLRVNERRAINTVVSKVPLKPEGSVSPVKITKKRSRSVDNAGGSPAKRISFEALRSSAQVSESPNRRVRTSVAPSPGGTSTPAVCRTDLVHADRYSLSAVTTPGQMSFVVDDFGDSTLDGIELPEEMETTELVDDIESPAKSEYGVTCAPSTQTPKAVLTATPGTTRRSSRRATTPAASTKKTPKTVRKTVAGVTTSAGTARTPLQAVGSGVLHGATVFVDVHTSEGADASGIFIELLTQMGAKCVREWRWNPRASLAPDGNSEMTEPKIGITHVIYKDGSKRTLEKVRDARGEVCCVGVAWVLDCERENKWLDESHYMVDTKIIPRGGSNRRKSMEPRALLVGHDGSISASRARRSVSAEMNELMKRELVNTPARGQTASVHDDVQSSDENDENVEQATPTGFISYDPRTAMTPGTPYLVSQGRKLTQMSAPPKQQNKSLFANDDDDDGDGDENEDTFIGGEQGNAGVVKDARKFRMRNLGDMAKRRRTLGWKPNVGSPLGKN